MKSTLLLLVFSFIGYCINAQSGTLDKTFGNNGKVFTTYSNEQFTAAASTIQNDDKIIVAGTYYSNNKAGFFVMRYLSKGRLDSNFGDNGIAIIHCDNSYINTRGVAIQENGKILVTGYGQLNGLSSIDMLTVRLNKNGTLDTLFGTKGKVISDFGTNEYSNSVCVQEDGKIILGGVYNNVECLLVRYKSNGILDSSFGVNGKVISAISLNTGISSVTVQANKKIVVGGTDQGSSQPIFLVGRFNQNGSVDSSFGSSGFVLTKCSNRGDILEKVLLQIDGKIIAVGSSGSYSSLSDTVLNMIAVRYKQNGDLDKSFGKTGIATIHQSSHYIQANSAVLQNDGKLLIAGYGLKKGSNDADYSLVRLKTNGGIDSLFGSNGFTFTNIKLSDIALGIGLQKTGDIILAGNSQTLITYTPGISLAAYYSDSANNYLDKHSNTSSVTIYPNPAVGNLYIKGLPSSGKIKFTIVDFEGNVYLQTIGTNGSYNLNVTSLKPGNYLLNIEATNEVFTKQFIKQ